jgi:hypothetical protein
VIHLRALVYPHLAGTTARCSDFGC